MAMNYRQYIVRDPAIFGGEPVVKGTRVTVRTVLASLAEGMSIAEIVKDFPTLDEDAVRAVIAFAAASAEEDLPVPPAPSLACRSRSTGTFRCALRVCWQPRARDGHADDRVTPPGASSRRRDLGFGGSAGGCR